MSCTRPVTLPAALVLSGLLAACQPQPGTGQPAATTIPEAMQGRWGLVTEDCTSTRGDAKGLITVAADHIVFYESRATLTGIAASSPGRLVADFSVSGEGMTWTRRMLMELQDGGATLVRREYGQDALPGALRYRTCAAVDAAATAAAPAPGG